MAYKNQPIFETRECLIDAEAEKGCKLKIEEYGIFLEFKLYDNRSKTKKKYARICLTDFFKQVWDHLTKEEQDYVRPEILKTIS